MARKIIIVGGSLSGAAVAARIRSLDSQAEIVLLEKSVSMAYAGTAWPGLLQDDTSTPLGQQTLSAEDFQRQYRVDVRANSEVTAIHRLRRQVEIRSSSDLQAKPYKEKYDYLVLATGYATQRPPTFTEAIDGTFTIKSPNDILQIRSWLQRPSVRSAVIVGGSPAGLQAALALRMRGLDVVLAEKNNHVLSMLDPDMARLVEKSIIQQGIQLQLSRQVIRVSRQDGRLFVQFADQSSLTADMVIVAFGNKPDTGLAVKAGLKTGHFGCLSVTAGGQTSDKRIYAAGALVSSAEMITGQPIWLNSAAAVISQARQAADHLCGRHSSPRSVLAITHLTVGGLEAGIAGASESDLLNARIDYSRTYSIIPGNDDQPYLAVKFLWARQSRQLLGVQMAGSSALMDKLAVVSLAIQSRQNITDLGRYDMPADSQQPGRRHWLTLAGQLAQNQLDGLCQDFSIYDLAALDTSRVILLDVRSREDFRHGTIPGSISLPLPDLVTGLQAGRIDLEPEKPVYIFSDTGRQGYMAARALKLAGRANVFNLAGGYWLYSRVVKG